MSEIAQTFSIPKTTGTHADIFAAVGLADLLASIPGLEPIVLVEQGAEIEVRLPRALRAEDTSRVSQDPGYPYLKPNAKHKVPPGIHDFVDYVAEKAKADRLKQAARSKQNQDMDTETQELIQQEQLRSDWRLLQVLNTLQGDDTTNKVFKAIKELPPEKFHEQVCWALHDLNPGTPVDAVQEVRPAVDRWPANLVQLFTPTAAKGYGRLKPDGTGRNDKTKERWIDPFLEWLKYRGYFRVACPYFQGPKAEHVRLLCPVPGDISVRALERVAGELRNGGVYGGPVKLDALAVLRLARLLVEHSEEYHADEAEPFPGLSIAGKSPAKVISGVTVTHYQSMGSAKAVSAMATLALPDWFLIQSNDDARAWLAILDEHQRVIRGLQDDHSDEIGLLIAYRRFLEKRGKTAIWALAEFMEQYGPFLIRAREQGRRVRSFRTDHFRRIVMGSDHKLAKILDDTGFQAIATAVRRATVNAQAQKAMGSKDYREIRYGLLHDLRRKRSLPGKEPLMEAVADFVSKYNAENARRREMGKQAPRNVTTKEFASFTALLDDHSASIVGALLCAYGSCREPRDDEYPPEPPETESESPETIGIEATKED